jgi:multidrug transporter EmrE-like cation transporter
VVNPIGRFMFGETVSLVNVIGVGVSVVGIVLMNYSRG